MHLDQRRRAQLSDTRWLVRNVPKDKASAAAKAAYMPDGMVTVPFNPQH